MWPCSVGHKVFKAATVELSPVREWFTCYASICPSNTQTQYPLSPPSHRFLFVCGKNLFKVWLVIQYDDVAVSFNLWVQSRAAQLDERQWRTFLYKDFIKVKPGRETTSTPSWRRFAFCHLCEYVCVCIFFRGQSIKIKTKPIIVNEAWNESYLQCVHDLDGLGCCLYWLQSFNISFCQKRIHLY